MDELLKVLNDLLRLDEGEVEAHTPLISSGLVDSFGVIVLLDELESQYGVTIEAEEVDADTFDTPQQILERLREAPA